MISRMAVLVGLLLCMVDMIPTLDALQYRKLMQPTGALSNTMNVRYSYPLRAFPLENAVFIEHSNLGIKKAMRWDESSAAFQQQALSESVKQTPLLNFFKNCFVPSGAISSDYYTYSLWRSAQRFVSATSSVFGTQALLLALGFKSNRIGIAAATTWVLKDALGKVSRIFWASKHGRKFDSDAKKWRFRSSLLYATGNGLEIFTYIVPSMFLLTAALANAFKQMAMLTSSATRNTIYKSFARSSDNIGDITAKGEAQIAVIDLLGMTAGVMISRAIGASRSKITGIFLGLSIFDLICIFKEIKSVIFTTLNFERTNIVLHHLFTAANGHSFAAVADETERGDSHAEVELKPSAPLMQPVIGNTEGSAAVLDNREGDNLLVDVKKVVKEEEVEKGRVQRRVSRSAVQSLTPVEVAVREPILLPTRFGEEIFRSWSTVECSAPVLRGSLDLFAGRSSSSDEVKGDSAETADKFIVTINARVPVSWVDAKRAVEYMDTPGWRQGLGKVTNIGSGLEQRGERESKYLLKDAAKNQCLKGGIFSYEERRRARMLASGWVNVLVALPSKPPGFAASEDEVEEEKEFQIRSKMDRERDRGHYCHACWGLVHSGPLRADCECCTAVIHRKCLPPSNGSPASSLLPVSEKGVVEGMSGTNSVSNSGASSSFVLPFSPWMCQDCEEDQESKKHYLTLRHRLRYRETMEMFAIVKVQSFSRMVRYRLDYLLAKIGFTQLQRLFHAKREWVKLKNYEEKRPRPFRLKIHDIRLFVRSPECFEGEILNPEILPTGRHLLKKIGEIGAGPYESFFRPGKPSEVSEHPLLEFFQHGHVEAPDHNLHPSKDPHVYVKGSMFVTVCVNELNEGQADSSESVQRTLTTKANKGRRKQLYRVDLPMRARKELKSERLTRSSLSLLGLPPMESSAFDKMADKFRLLSFQVENPYILIPECSSCVSVTITISQVSLWPRAITVGQTYYVIKKHLFTNRVAAWHQWTSPSDWDNLPEMDELKKLIITLPEIVPKIAGIGEGKKDSISFANSSVKRGILSSPTSRGGSRPSTSYHSRPSSSLSSRSVSSPVTSSFSPSPVTPPFSSTPSPSLPLIRSVSALSCTAHPILKNLNVTNTHAHIKTNTFTRNNNNNSNSNNSNSNGSQELQAEALGGIVTWSLLTMTNENQNEGGYLLSLPRGVGDRAGARREIWCVLVDRVFHNFASHETLKPRFQTDLRHCTVTAFEGGVFALESVRSAVPSQSFKALYFMGRNKREGAKWFWKLYYQSASNNIVKYSNLNFRPGGAASSFCMTKLESEEVGLRTSDSNSSSSQSLHTNSHSHSQSHSHSAPLDDYGADTDLNREADKRTYKEKDKDKHRKTDPFSRRATPTLTALRNDPALSFLLAPPRPALSIAQLMASDEVQEYYGSIDGQNNGNGQKASRKGKTRMSLSEMLSSRCMSSSPAKSLASTVMRSAVSCRENRRASYEHKGENEDETPIAIALAMAVMRANAKDKDKHKDGDREQGYISPMDVNTGGSSTGGDNSNTSNTRHSGLWTKRSLLSVQEIHGKEAEHSAEHSSNSLSLLHPAAYDDGAGIEDVHADHHDGGYNSEHSSDSSLNARKRRKEMIKSGGRSAPVRVSKSRLASLMGGHFHHPDESAETN